MRLEDLPPAAGVTYLDDPHEMVSRRAPPRGLTEAEEGDEGAEGTAAEGAAAGRRAARTSFLRGVSPWRSSAGESTASTSTSSSQGSGTPAGSTAGSAQRRLDGRRRARATPRRLVQVEVQGTLRGPGGRRATRAARAGDLHERVRASIQAAAAFFKVPAERLLVVHDDVDLPAARLQARLGGGLAGHNGLRSIAQRLGTQEFLRLRDRRRSARARRPPPGRRLRPSPFAPGRRRGRDRGPRGRRRGGDRRARPRRGPAPIPLAVGRGLGCGWAVLRQGA